MNFSRRSFLAALPPLAFSVSPSFAAALGTGSSSFAAIARQLGGIASVSPFILDAADVEFAQAYGFTAQAAFVKALQSGPLDARIAEAGDEIQAQARFVVQFLYTGEVVRDGETKAVYYPWCLAWQALTFASAPGLCGGPAFGHWTHAPTPGAM
jgi:hypothetical protein